MDAKTPNADMVHQLCSGIKLKNVFDAEVEIPDIDVSLSPFMSTESFVFDFHPDDETPFGMSFTDCNKLGRAFIHDVAQHCDLELVNCNLYDHLDNAFAVYKLVRIVWTCNAWTCSGPITSVGSFSIGYDCSQQWWSQHNVPAVSPHFGGTLILLPSAIPIFLWRTVVPYRCPLLPVQSLCQCWSCYNHDMCCTRLLSSRIQWEGVGFHGPNQLPTAEELFSPDEIFVIGGPCFPALYTAAE